MDQLKKLNVIIILLAIVIGLEVFNSILNQGKLNLQSQIYGAVDPKVPNTSTLAENPAGPHITNTSPEQLYIGGTMRIRATRLTPNGNNLYFCLNTDQSCSGEYSGMIKNVHVSQGMLSIILPKVLSPAASTPNDTVARKPITHGLTQGKYNFYLTNEYGQSNTVAISISAQDPSNTLKFSKLTDMKLGAQKILQDGAYSVTFESVKPDNRCVGECANAPKREAIVHLILNEIPPANNCPADAMSDNTNCASQAAGDPVSVDLTIPNRGGTVTYGSYVFSLTKLLPKTQPTDPKEYIATITVTKLSR